MKIAFLGLGAMGHPMAERLVERGFDVRVWNRTPRTVAGAATFETAGACVAGTSVVVTMLANADVVEAARDADRLMRRHHGEFARFNFSE